MAINVLEQHWAEASHRVGLSFGACRMENSADNLLARFRWHVRGQVQGVGFRPFVYRHATACQLSGFVRNNLRGVHIEAQGRRERLVQFDQILRRELPPLARPESIAYSEVDLLLNEEPVFRIDCSCLRGEARIAITVDTAVCEDCVTELLSTDDRRSGYALTNCTACGPRYTIVRSLPYDRPNTTMSGFTMCAKCEHEYTSPSDRRFHAQPIACPQCGPQLQMVDTRGSPFPGDPIDGCARALHEGAIVAIKGIGGFHLVVRASDGRAVARLRERKLRDAKPLAVMCQTLDEAAKLVELSLPATAALTSPARPIVLARCRPNVEIADNVAPGIGMLGVMLPYTPIHHLLFTTTPPLGPLVMTSGNLSDEPLVIDNQEALARLGKLCDFLLWHDRPIQRRVDDSVVRDMGATGPLPMRRARGYVPQGLKLPQPPPIKLENGLCLGGELKNTIALVRGNEVILSQHLGDLKHPLAYENYQRTIADLLRLYNIQPQWIACDLHPSYLSSQYAQRLANQWQLPLLKIQHHHAHAASLMSEHDRTQPVIAVVCDGIGYGVGGSIWGGELLLADFNSMQRLAHLRPLLLAGGDAAALDVRRCGLALLQQIAKEQLSSHPLAAELYPDQHDRCLLTGMLQREVESVWSTATGRYFDAFAALLDLCQVNKFEAESGMLLEAAASKALRRKDQGPLYLLKESTLTNGAMEIDFAPLVQQVVELRNDKANNNELAWLFHQQLACAWEAAVLHAIESTQVETVALTGGVFCNRLLTEMLTQRLTARGLQVLRHTQVPCNDGGLALGQAAIAGASLQGQHNESEGSFGVTALGTVLPQVCHTL